MKALILGGTGVLSTDTVEIAMKHGWEITVLNRRQRAYAQGISMSTDYLRAHPELQAIDEDYVLAAYKG